MNKLCSARWQWWQWSKSQTSIVITKAIYSIAIQDIKSNIVLHWYNTVFSCYMLPHLYVTLYCNTNSHGNLILQKWYGAFSLYNCNAHSNSNKFAIHCHTFSCIPIKKQCMTIGILHSKVHTWAQSYCNRDHDTL